MQNASSKKSFVLPEECKKGWVCNMTYNDPIMTIINKNLSYKDRREVMDIVSESIQSKDVIYTNISGYFLNRILKLNPLKMLRKYTDSKGDINKIKNINTTIEAVDFLEKDINVSRDAKVIKEALLNIKNRKRVFSLGFAADSEVVKLIYSITLKGCIATTSLLINRTNMGGGYGFSKNPNERLLSIIGLEMFNKFCKDGSLDKVLRIEIDAKKKKLVKESVFDTIAELPFKAIGAIGSAVIVGIRSLVYWVYYTRMDMAEYLEHQAAYIEMNKYALENRQDIPEAKKKEIIKKQTEWQNRLLDLADKIQIDEIKAVKKAQEQAAKDEKDFRKEDATGDGSDTDTSTPDFF